MTIVCFYSEKEDIGYMLYLRSIINSKGLYTRKEKANAREELKIFEEENPALKWNGKEYERIINEAD